MRPARFERAASSLIVLRRRDLHQTLLNAAVEAGAELITGCTVLGATTDGTVALADGSSVRADVVVAADGVHSRIREGLDLTQSYRRLPDGATRVLIPRQEEAYSTEYWAGPHRVGVVPVDLRFGRVDHEQGTSAAPLRARGPLVWGASPSPDRFCGVTPSLSTLPSGVAGVIGIAGSRTPDPRNRLSQY